MPIASKMDMEDENIETVTVCKLNDIENVEPTPNPSEANMVAKIPKTLEGSMNVTGDIVLMPSTSKISMEIKNPLFYTQTNTTPTKLILRRVQKRLYQEVSENEEAFPEEDSDEYIPNSADCSGAST
ncbi:uncharacterized protein LOC115880150 [Sitophilus oryzae]|uniref:Uncharacterized protein LOC115880150 n=1 Tax=Sitophilus oryzae TaxID=7048 RepID=A0A6J2XNP5_SITOR|nr:uncharacterized protein LOC115880150 [Sitophilus oryzae]